MDGTGILGPGATVMFLSIKFVREVIFLEKNGRWTRTKKSAWIKEENGSVRWISLVPLFVSVACNVGVTIVMTYAWNFAAQAGLNPGLISSLFCFSSIFNIVVFYCAFGEKVSKFHLIGVALMFCSVCCLGVSASLQDEADLDEDLDTGGRSVAVNGLLAIVVGMGGPGIISFNHYIIRKFSGNYEGVDQALDAAAIQNPEFCLFLIPLSKVMDITANDLMVGAAAEVLMESARVGIAYGVHIGLAGPAQALMSTHALWQVLAGAIFANSPVSALQIAALLLGLAGVSLISYFDHLLTKLTEAKKKRKLAGMASSAASTNVEDM